MLFSSSFFFFKKERNNGFIVIVNYKCYLVPYDVTFDLTCNPTIRLDEVQASDQDKEKGSANRCAERIVCQHLMYFILCFFR